MTPQPHPYRPQPSPPLQRGRPSPSADDPFGAADTRAHEAGSTAGAPTNLPASWTAVSQADGDA